MQQFWVPASKALAVVAREGGEYGGREAICKRAHAGLLKSKARLLIVDDDTRENVEIPAHFWWADGQEALEQDWHRGDFSTWFNRDVEIRAFGVEFDFNGLREMIPPGEVAALARGCSVSADPDWMSAGAAQRFAYEKLGAPPAVAGNRVIDQAKLGFVPARAVLMQRSNSGVSESWHVGEREWDVPDWFWEKFTQTGSSSQDWARGVFRGKDGADRPLLDQADRCALLKKCAPRTRNQRPQRGGKRDQSRRSTEERVLGRPMVCRVGSGVPWGTHAPAPG